MDKQGIIRNAVQETMTGGNGKESRDKYTWYFSGEKNAPKE